MCIYLEGLNKVQCQNTNHLFLALFYDKVFGLDSVFIVTGVRQGEATVTLCSGWHCVDFLKLIVKTKTVTSEVNSTHVILNIFLFVKLSVHLLHNTLKQALLFFHYPIPVTAQCNSKTVHLLSYDYNYTS